MGPLAANQGLLSFATIEAHEQGAFFTVPLGPIGIALKEDVVIGLEFAGIAGQEIVQPAGDCSQVDRAAEDRDLVPAGLLVQNLVLATAELDPMLLRDRGIESPAVGFLGGDTKPLECCGFLRIELLAGLGLAKCGGDQVAVGGVGLWLHVPCIFLPK